MAIRKPLTPIVKPQAAASTVKIVELDTSLQPGSDFAAEVYFDGSTIRTWKDSKVASSIIEVSGFGFLPQDDRESLTRVEDEFWKDSGVTDIQQHKINRIHIRIPGLSEVIKPIFIQCGDEREEQNVLEHLTIELGENSVSSVFLIDCKGKQSSRPLSFQSLRSIRLAANAHLKFYYLQDHAGTINARSMLKYELMEQSWLEHISCNLGGSEILSDEVFNLQSEGTNAVIHGLYIPSKSQKMTIRTRQMHEAHDSVSNLVYKGVLLDQSTSIWKGMIKIAPEAVRSQSYQTNNNLILSEKAHVDSIPGMEILTNDVQCKHGATVGKLDPTQLFYLESRGIDPVDVKRLLIEGFLDPIIQKFPVERIRDRIYQKIHEKIEARSGHG